jgi:hypothetical protein
MNEQTPLEGLESQKKWLDLPWDYRMETTYGAGGRKGGNIDEKQIQDYNGLRWFLFNLDVEDNKQVAVAQRQLNSVYDKVESGLSPLEAKGELDQRTTARIKNYIELFDAYLDTDKDTREAVRIANQVMHHRKSPFTMSKDTTSLKERLDELNFNKETAEFLKELEMIAK